MTDTLITDVQQGIIDQLDSTALNLIIWDYLNNPDNGFMDQEEVITINDATACTWVTTPADDATSADTTACIFIDSTEVTWIDTTALWTVEEWKDVYYELTFNDAMTTVEKIGFLDSSSPNNPLTNYENILFNFDTSESLNYPMTPDTTGDLYIDFIYPTAQKIDGLFFQGGEDGAQYYDSTSSDSTAEIVMLAGYVSYSKNGTDWKYLKNSVANTVNDAIAITATDSGDAADSPFIFRYTSGFENIEIANVVFDDVALEAQYWRFHIVDLLPYLESVDLAHGYTGYTAAVSHLRFQQFKLNGSFVVTQTLPGDAIVPGGIGGDQIGNGEIEERHLADFSIGWEKLAPGVAGILDINRTNDFGATGVLTWVTMAATFTIQSDDGYSPISIMFQCYSKVATNSGRSDDLSQIQVYNDAGSWVTVESSWGYDTFSADATLHSFPTNKSLVYTEGLRSTNSRIFRFQAQYNTGGTNTFSTQIRAIAVYAE